MFAGPSAPPFSPPHIQMSGGVLLQAASHPARELRLDTLTHTNARIRPAVTHRFGGEPVPGWRMRLGDGAGGREPVDARDTALQREVRATWEGANVCSLVGCLRA